MPRRLGQMQSSSIPPPRRSSHRAIDQNILASAETASNCSRSDVTHSLFKSSATHIQIFHDRKPAIELCCREFLRQPARLDHTEVRERRPEREQHHRSKHCDRPSEYTCDTIDHLQDRTTKTRIHPKRNQVCAVNRFIRTRSARSYRSFERSGPMCL